ncbi:MAG TPA: methyltransferase domain-containing protein [Baekduia sp.]|nr:methyltransferase domain-containing protein [Baekduia sp.]HMJ33229.1 methyltransferase domain-containing protein [Baekduia sp.]
MTARRDLYDTIGAGYATGRRTDPRIAEAIAEALGDAETVLNVGAGTGSYEPPDRDVTAVEPSAVMRAQRPAGAAPCVAAYAEALPFDDSAFDVAMAVLSDHHWRDNAAGLRELRRVARRVVLFQWDNVGVDRFWLVRDYVPEFVAYADGPSLADRARLLAPDARIDPVPIPWDCVDGFFHAHWRRPEAYLREDVRRVTSVWSQVGRAVEARAVAALGDDLASGAWQERNAELLHLEASDQGARLVVAETP